MASAPSGQGVSAAAIPPPGVVKTLTAISAPNASSSTAFAAIRRSAALSILPMRVSGISGRIVTATVGRRVLELLDWLSSLEHQDRRPGLK